MPDINKPGPHDDFTLHYEAKPYPPPMPEYPKEQPVRKPRGKAGRPPMYKDPISKCIYAPYYFFEIWRDKEFKKTVIDLAYKWAQELESPEDGG